MSKFEGEPCQICGVKFVGQDEVVACPECGAPYHKSCYEKTGHCVFEEAHGKEGCYQPPKRKREVVCANCGKHNSPNAEVCEFCNKKLSSKELVAASQILNNLDLVIKPDVAKGDVAEDELVSEFVGSNVEYFKAAFSGKHRFNFGAFVCPVFYYFYRKMYAVGCAFYGVLIALVYIMLRQSRNIYLTVAAQFSQMGLTPNEILEQIKKMALTGGELPRSLQRSVSIIWIALLLVLAVMIFSGFVANKIYRNYVYNKISRCREISKEHYQKLILLVGGVSPGAAVLAVFSFVTCMLFL